MKEVNGGYISRTFYKIKSPKTNQTESRVEKVINTKGDKLYSRWKGCNNLFHLRIDRKGIVV